MTSQTYLLTPKPELPVTRLIKIVETVDTCLNFLCKHWNNPNSHTSKVGTKLCLEVFSHGFKYFEKNILKLLIVVMPQT